MPKRKRKFPSDEQIMQLGMLCDTLDTVWKRIEPAYKQAKRNAKRRAKRKTKA